MTTAEGNGSSV